MDLGFQLSQSFYVSNGVRQGYSKILICLLVIFITFSKILVLYLLVVALKMFG